MPHVQPRGGFGETAIPPRTTFRRLNDRSFITPVAAIIIIIAESAAAAIGRHPRVK